MVPHRSSDFEVDAIEAGDDAPVLSVDGLLASFEQEESIIAQARRGSARRASVMLTAMLESDAMAEPELESFATVIASQARSPDGSATTAVEVLDKMIASKTCRPTAVIVNAVLDAHAKCGDGSAPAALALLARMDKEVRLDTISYNTAINACAKCQDGSVKLAGEAFASMIAHGVVPNTVTYHSLLDAEARQSDGTAGGAVKVLDDMQARCTERPDVSMFTTAINLQARARDGSARGALQLLARMKAAGCAPTAVTLNSVIDAQSKRADGSAKVAVTILDAMRRSTIPEVRPTVVTYTSVIDAQAKCPDGEGRTAVALLEEMCTEGIKPNHMTFGCCMNAQAKRGSARMAGSILRKMIEFGLTPSYMQFNAVLDAYARCPDGSARDAVKTLAEMKALGGKPNVTSYSTAIDAQARKPDGSAVAASRLFEELLADGLRPDTVTFAGVIDAQAKCHDGSAKVAAAVVDRMSTTVTPNQVHFNSALNACANERPAKPALATEILAKMQAHGFKATSYTLSALLRCACFAEPAQPELARRWFTELGPELTEVNDHVARALRGAVGEEVASKLIVAVGHVEPAPTERAGPPRRSSRANIGSPGLSPNSSPSPPLTRRRSSRVSVGHVTPANSGASWRASPGSADGSRQPSSQLFSQPRRLSSQLSLEKRPSWRDRSKSAELAPSSALFSQPRRSCSGPGSLGLGPGLGAVSRAGSVGQLNVDSLIPSDMPVSQMGRRGSAPRLARGGSVDSGLGGLLGLGGPRLSLSDKIKAIQEESATTPAAGPRLPSRRGSSQLLAPDFFTADSRPEKEPSPLLSTPAATKGRRSSLVREPCGPDGTRGFGARRMSADSFNTRLLPGVRSG